MDVRLMLRVGFVLIGTSACGHASSHAREEPPAQRAIFDAYGGEPEDGVRIKGGNSASARIHALIAQGEFAEAEALIAEASAGGLISKEYAARLLNDIARLNMRLGEIPARLQRARDFPSQLKDYTLHQIDQMLKARDFTLATNDQLKMAKKLILESPRLMEKNL